MLKNRRIYSVVFAFSLLSLWTAAARVPAGAQQPQGTPATAPVSVLTESNDGETIAVNVGDVIAVRLQGNSSTGYAWAVDRISNQRAKQLGAVVYADTPLAGTTPAVGRAGVYTVNFQAVQPGVATVELKYARPSIKDQAPVKTFAFTFDVLNARSAQAQATRRAIPAQAAAVPNGVPAPSATPKFVQAVFVSPRGNVKYLDGSSYSGGLANGIPSGPGTFSFTPKAGGALSAEGNWSGRALSDGVVTLPGGVHYFGGLDTNGKSDGPGRFEFPGGAVLASTFRDAKYSGETTWLAAGDAANRRRFRSRLVVEVEPPAPTVSGRATETFEDGYTLLGTMRDGVFEGPGTYRSAKLVGYGDATTLRGSFSHGRLEGPFLRTDRDGSVIAGTFRHGNPAGPAVYTAPRGKPCRGGISRSGDFYPFNGPLNGDGRPNGRGTFGCPHDEQLTGQWSGGRMVGVISDRLTNGTIYRVDVGPRPSDYLAGPARVTLANGNVVNGRLRRDGNFISTGADR